MPTSNTKPAAKRAPAKKAPAKSAAAKSTTKPAEGEQAKPARKSSVVTDATIAKVTQAVKSAGKEGATLSDLVSATGLTYRQVHNATWRMEGSPKDGACRKPEERVISRINTDRKVRYVLREAGTPTPVMRGKFATRGALD